jgi:hypothetical protein
MVAAERVVDAAVVGQVVGESRDTAACRCRAGRRSAGRLHRRRRCRRKARRSRSASWVGARVTMFTAPPIALRP